MDEARPLVSKRSSWESRPCVNTHARKSPRQRILQPDSQHLEAMGASASRAKPVPERTPVPAGKVRVCVAGFAVSHNVGRAAAVARAIVANRPDQFESWFYFDSKGARQPFISLAPGAF